MTRAVEIRMVPRPAGMPGALDTLAKLAGFENARDLEAKVIAHHAAKQQEGHRAYLAD